MAQRLDVKTLRRRLGYTQERLATDLGVDRTTVIRWERSFPKSSPSGLARRSIQTFIKSKQDQLRRRDPGDDEGASAPAADTDEGSAP